MIDRRRLVLGSASTLLLSLAPWQIARGARMVDDRKWPAEENTRVTLEYDSPLNFKYFFVRSSKPLRLVVDIKGLELTVALQKQIAAVKPDDPYIAAMRIGQFQPDTVRRVMDLKTDVKPEVFQLQPLRTTSTVSSSTSIPRIRPTRSVVCSTASRKVARHPTATRSAHCSQASTRARPARR